MFNGWLIRGREDIKCQEMQKKIVKDTSGGNASSFGVSSTNSEMNIENKNAEARGLCISLCCSSPCSSSSSSSGSGAATLTEEDIEL